MTLITSLVSFLALTVAAVTALPSNGALTASPVNGAQLEPRHDYCLTDSQAINLKHTWISFFVKADKALLKKTLAPEFQLVSDSTAFFFGPHTALAPFEPTKDKFIADQLAATAKEGPPFTVVDFGYGCNFFTFHWSVSSANSKGPVTLTGIDLVFVTHDHKIRRAISEFNNALLL